MKIKIDRDGCIACGQCMETCPEVFRMADDGFAEVYNEPTEENESMAREAADNCPVQVIHCDE